MPVRPCPKCQNPDSRCLEGASQGAFVWYFRCQSCSHIWNVLKEDPDGTPRPNVLKADLKDYPKPVKKDIPKTG